MNLRCVRMYCMPYLISGNVVFLTGTCFYRSNLFERPCITFEIQLPHNCARRPCCRTFYVEFGAPHPQVLLATENIFFSNNVPNNNRCSNTVPCNNTHSGGRGLLKLLPAGKFCIFLSLRSELASCTA